VDAFDNYYTGNLTDHISGMRYELDMPQSYSVPSDFSAPANTSTLVTIFPNNATTPFLPGGGAYNGNSPSQTGLLVLYTDAKTGQEASLITVNP
jgi:hypothetical protein